MRNVLHLDVESFSECELKSAGVYRYAEHPSTELLVVGYRFDDGPVHLWIPYNAPGQIQAQVRERAPSVRIWTGCAVPADIRKHIVSGGQIRAHNAAFERVVLNGVAGRKVNFPFIRIEQVVCTAAKAAAAGLPRALSDAAKALKTHLKDDSGRIAMLQLTKPRKPTKDNPATRWTPDTAPDKFLQMYLYNVDDVLAEADLDAHLPDLSPSEQEVYRLDQRINERGIAVDLKAVADVQHLIAEYKTFLEAACVKACGVRPSQRDKVAEWVRANGWPKLLDLQADTVRLLLLDDAVPENVKHVLRIYSTYNMKAPTKYNAIENMVCADGRLRGMFLYHGAGTGRWSSLGVQLQNLARGHIDDPETAVEAFSARDLEWIRCLYAGVDPMKVFASTVRSVLVAGEGKDLLFPDYAGIEARVNAWLFGEQWKIEAYRAFDAGVGPDLYKVGYARAFAMNHEDVTKPQRQIGKVMELAFGYEGGVGALVTMSETYGMDLDEMAEAAYQTLPQRAVESAEWMWEKFGRGSGLAYRTYITCDSLKYLWREGHPRIRQGWRDLKDAAEMAVQNPGGVYALANGKIKFKRIEYRGRSWLVMGLPSGRRLMYFDPEWIPARVVQEKNEHGVLVDRVIPGEIRYSGIDTKTRRWCRTSTYGGKLCENAVQAIASDILRRGMQNLEAHGYPVIGSVHDEALAEPDQGHGSFEEAAELMCRQDAWTAGLPLAVEGHRCKRYRK